MRFLYNSGHFIQLKQNIFNELAPTLYVGDRDLEAQNTCSFRHFIQSSLKMFLVINPQSPPWEWWLP